ncbi:MAG TPA: 3-oxoacyl-ACP reductase FabG [Acidimicrobiia bacterium]|nr:3-oxoacyl-ACP reductase FabG [Acidimicrobiia bacterium]
MSGVLLGQVVLVTGGSGGIGGAVANAAALEGAEVAIAYLDDEEQASAQAEEISRRGGKAAIFAADLTDGDQARSMVKEVERHFGRIDGLVNNAGIMPETAFLEISDEEWDRVIRTDLTAAFVCTQAALPGMLRRRKGAVVMISSRLGQVGWPGVAHYSAAKAGLLGLTKSLAREFGPQGIRVNAVAPGVTVTAMTAGIVEHPAGERRLAEIPAGRFAQPEEIAATVIFLLSEAAALYHGQTLCPNGGSHMP